MNDAVLNRLRKHCGIWLDLRMFGEADSCCLRMLAGSVLLAFIRNKDKPMIKFFRKIRQKLLSENKVSRYLIYAIGEIVLVVIGILIALQINNWNENRKSQLKSYDYLKRLKVDLDNVYEDVNGSLRRSDLKYHDALVALEVLEAKELPSSKQKVFERHLANYYKFQIAIQTPTAYDEMLSSGDLGLIKNESLRTAFSNLSDGRDFIITINQSYLNAYNNNMDVMEKYTRYHIQNVDTDSSKVSVSYDFDAMTKDELFINQISNQVNTWYKIFNVYKVHLSRVNKIKDSVQIELKKYDE
ncbi:DUF6090 family protein [Neolewinella persica]|uniref:DUF6090 family protein n=1 Tax=Neolewinella persica TaxID=70998 RepID=UPI0005C44D0B|nr:DUF6090 family protein [Neolewinella persica]